MHPKFKMMFLKEIKLYIDKNSFAKLRQNAKVPYQHKRQSDQ